MLEIYEMFYCLLFFVELRYKSYTSACLLQRCGNLGREQITFKTQRFLIVFYDLRCLRYTPHIYSVPCDQTTYVKKVICLKPVDRKWRGGIDPFFDHETKSSPCLSSHILSPSCYLTRWGLRVLSPQTLQTCHSASCCVHQGDGRGALEY
jgi:hypothetical protein